MAQIKIPYGRTGIAANISGDKLLGIYEAGLPAEAADPIAEVENALDNPIGSKKLEELAVPAFLLLLKSKKNVICFKNI